MLKAIHHYYVEGPRIQFFFIEAMETLSIEVANCLSINQAKIEKISIF